jgi:uncharacterized Zn-finger protein
MTTATRLIDHITELITALAPCISQPASWDHQLLNFTYQIAEPSLAMQVQAPPPPMPRTLRVKHSNPEFLTPHVVDPGVLGPDFHALHRGDSGALRATVPAPTPSDIPDVSQLPTTRRGTAQPPCPECSMILYSPYLLRRHMLVHGERNVPCHYCAKPFKRRDTCARHERTQHCQNNSTMRKKDGIAR